MHFYSMTYMATPQHKNPCPRGHEIYNFGRPFVCHHFYILVFQINAWEQRRRFLKIYSNFTLFTLQLPPLLVGGSHEMSPYPINATYQISLRLAQQFLRRCNARRTTDDDGRQHIAIGHLSDSKERMVAMQKRILLAFDSV